jgi:hypothetical protein
MTGVCAFVNPAATAIALGPVSQNCLRNKICLKIKICRKIHISCFTKCSYLLSHILRYTNLMHQMRISIIYISFKVMLRPKNSKSKML